MRASAHPRRIERAGHWIFGLGMLVPLCSCGEAPADLEAEEADALPTAQSEELPDFEGLGHFGYTDFSESEDEEDLQREGVVHCNQERSVPGYNLYADIPFSAAHLIDAQGLRIHSWHQSGVGSWQRAVLLAVGDLMVIGTASPAEDVAGKPRELRFQGGRLPYLARYAWDGSLRWRRDVYAHHDVDLLPNGDFLVLTERWSRPAGEYHEDGIRDNVLTRFSADGEVLAEQPVYELLAAQPGVLRWKLPKDQKGWPADLLHLNSARWVNRPDLPADSPLAGANTVLISSRHQDLIFVVDMEERALRWSWGRGLVQRQHEATVLESGNILLFDNGSTGRPWSRIVELDPRTEQIVWEYRATPPEAFYSEGRGTAQGLPGGNVLVGNSGSGEAFEVTREGDIVWHFLNPSRDELMGGRAALTIRRYPVEFVEAIQLAMGER